MIGIYKITNKINDKCYIGLSVSINDRFAEHKRNAYDTGYKGYDYPLYRAIRKYGLHNFSFEVLEQCTRAVLKEREAFYIAQYNSNDSKYGYNQNGGGDSPAYVRIHDNIVDRVIDMLANTSYSYKEIADALNVTKCFIGEINCGKRRRRDDVQYPIRKKPCWNKAISHCEICGKPLKKTKSKHCLQCSQILQRTVERPEPLELARMIKEIGFVQVGKRFGVSDTAVQKWCKSCGIPHKINDLSVWYDEQMGILPEPCRPRKKKGDIVRPVLQIDPISGITINCFENQSIAAKALGFVDGSGIGRVLRGQQKLAFGYKWAWAS